MSRLGLLSTLLIALVALDRGLGEDAKPEKRHPGHQLKAEFLLKKEGYVVGGPVVVELKIENVGKTPFTFMRGGMQRGFRDNQFAFSAGTWDKMLPDIGNPQNFGGIGTYVTLKAGESAQIPVDLKKWFAFDSPGIFTVRGSYLMHFYDPDSETHRAIWTDFACAEFGLTLQKAGSETKGSE